MIALAFAALLAAAGPIETSVEIPGPLKGTQVAPATGAKGPAALILPNSRAIDRDGETLYGSKGPIYRLLAEGLAAEGVTTVRIDKRGQFASAAAAADPNKVLIADLAADANAWAADLKARTGAPCVWLIGHDEGALVAEVAGRSGKDICGLVLVAGSGERLGEAFRRQLKANLPPGQMLDQALAAIAAIEAGRPADTARMPLGLAQMFAPELQPQLTELSSYDPAQLLARYPGPVLILQGPADIRVTIDDAEMLKAAKPDAVLVKLEADPALKDPAADAGSPIYSDAFMPLAPNVARTIADFIKSH